ncbi:unnamed protein product [Arabidopsis halleri]
MMTAPHLEVVKEKQRRCAALAVSFVLIKNSGPIEKKKKTIIDNM